MNASKQRRIQVASFSTDDVSRAHLLSFVAGVVLCGLAVAAGWGAAANLRAGGDAKGAARQVMVVASHALQGSQQFSAGKSDHLTSAVQYVSGATAAMAELQSAQSMLVAPGLSQSASTLGGVWSQLAGSLGEIQSSIARSGELSDGLGKAAPALAGLVKQIEAGGRHTGVLSRAYDSAVRLYTYAEAGFGPASVARVDYDLRVLASDLGATDLRGSIAFVDALLPVSKTAAGAPLAREQLLRVVEASQAAKATAESLGLQAQSSNMALLYGAGSLSLLIAGLVASWVSLRSVTADFGRRYVRAMAQFRAGESARQELANKLRSAIDHGSSDFAVHDQAPEVQELADLVAELAGRHQRVLIDISSAVSSAIDIESGTSKSAGAIDACGRDIHAGLSEVNQRIARLSARSLLSQADAAAAAHAAEEAGQRSADANRIAQDAASRLEALREGLQETSKGIKRLGERTQDINGVVDTMELVVEQIQVLSLNASLEAERAGEAGAGFRHVAKEVQALARRSEQALAQMSALVQGAQADARSAAESVDKSTSQAVAGTSIGAVSQALLGAMTPLASSVHAMTKSIADAARDDAQALEATEAQASRSMSSLNELSSAVGRLKSPLTQLRSQLDEAVQLAGAAR